MEDRKPIAHSCKFNPYQRPFPWEDKNGKLLSLLELRFVSRQWHETTWKAYLQTLEVPQREYLSARFGTLQYGFNVKKSLGAFLYGGEESNSEAFAIPANQVRTALLLLTPREREVIQGIFFDELEMTQVAALLGISRERVGFLLRRSLKKLKAHFQALMVK